MQINGFIRGGIVLSENTSADDGARRARHPLVLVLAAIVFAEFLLLVGATGFLVIELLVATPSSYASAIVLTALVAAAAVWLAVITVNILRCQHWVRSATLVWQVLQIAVAVGSFQGIFARQDIGWLLLIPAVAAMGVLFTRPVIEATARRE
ncbi:MAG: hypothetical protein LH471_08060 [Salinibacterium sp.]|nr:hypothetical protein [Salinibacterium sp.]